MPPEIEEIKLPGAIEVDYPAHQFTGHFQFNLSTSTGYIQVNTAAHGFGSSLGVKFPIDASDTTWLRFHFMVRAQEWKRETGHISSMAKTVLHPAYQAIIGMGKPALPLIFEQLQRDRDHWLWALRAITQEDPARGLVDFDEAVEAWLRWGKDHGYL